MAETGPPLITISGPPASGTSTVSDHLAEHLDFEVVDGGQLFRELANERDVSPGELNELSEQNDSIDRTIDCRLESIIAEHVDGTRQLNGNGLIVESRLAGWHARKVADLTVFLTAPLEVRAERLTDRDETAAELAAREKSETKRYDRYYDIDITDTSIYDVVIDTSDNTVEDVVERILDELAL